MKSSECKYNGGRDIARPPSTGCLPAKVLLPSDDNRDGHIHGVDDDPIRDRVHGLANAYLCRIADAHNADIRRARYGGNRIGLPDGK